MCWHLQRQEMRVRSPGAGVVSSQELPVLGSGNQAQLLEG